MARHLLLILLLSCIARAGGAAVFDATSADFTPSYLSTGTPAGGGPWRIWNDQAAMAPVVGAFTQQAGPLVYSGSEQGIAIQTAGVARSSPAYAVLGSSLDMILARATDDQGIYVVARAPGDLLATPALLVPLNPTVAMTWTADPWGPDHASHPGQTLTYEVLSLTATAPRSGLPGCLQIEETNSYSNQRRTFYWQVGTPWPVEVQDDRSLDAGSTLTWSITPLADLIAPSDPVGVWIRQGSDLATGEYRVVAFFANGTWARIQRLAAQDGTSLWQIGTWRLTGPGTIETSVTYRVGNPAYLDALGSVTPGQPFSQSPTGALTFHGETYDRAAQSGSDGAYWFGQDPDGYGVIADLDGTPASGDEPGAGLALFSGATYLFWQDDGTTPGSGSEWGTTANLIPVSGFDATVVGDENGASGFANGPMPALFAPTSLLAPSILPGAGLGDRIAAAEFAVTYDGNGSTIGSAPGPQSKVQGVDLVLTSSTGGLGRSGSIFAGWNTAADGSGLAFAPGDVLAIDVPLQLYAAWTVVPGGGSPTFGFVDGSHVRQVIAGDRVILPVRVTPNLGLELLASVVFTAPFAGLDAANGNWPTPAGTASTVELISGTRYQRLAPGVTQQALVLTIPSGASGTMTVAFGPDVQGLIAADLTASVDIRVASTTPMPAPAAEYVAGQDLSPFSVKAGDTVTQQALLGTAVSGPQDLNLVAVNGTPPYTATVLAGSAEIRAWKPFAAAVDWDTDGNADTGQWFSVVPRAPGSITIRISDSLGQTQDSTMPVVAGVGGSANVPVPASSQQTAVYTLAGAAGFGGVDALLARFQGAGANPLVRRGFVYSARAKAWSELPALPAEGRPMPWDGFYLADRTGDDLLVPLEALGVPPYIPLYPGWNVLALPPLRQGGGTVLPSISATDLDLYDEYGNTIARSAFEQVIGRPQTWNGSSFVELSTIDVGQGFFLKNNLSGTNPRMLYLVPGRQALSAGSRASLAGTPAAATGLAARPRALLAHPVSGSAEIVPATGVMGRPPAPPAAVGSQETSASGGGCGGAAGLVLMALCGLGLLGRRGTPITRD
jgi:hypothetical protein